MATGLSTCGSLATRSTCSRLSASWNVFSSSWGESGASRTSGSAAVTITLADNTQQTYNQRRIIALLSRQLVQHAYDFIGHAFASADLGIAVQAHPGLIAAHRVSFLVGQVTDPVVGQLDHDGVLERRAALD